MNKILFQAAGSIITLAAFVFSAKAQNAYFQQEVNYQIDVKLNDTNHTLSAFIEIEYINNSPDSLNVIYMHLWPNAYKNNYTALANQLLESGQTNFYYSEKKEKGFIDSLDFKVNGAVVLWELDEDHIDIAKIILPTPLLPGAKMMISTPYFVKIPIGTFSRLGHIGQQYQITQWYPKPAVYDNKGWHQMPYLNQGEFYSEFGSFLVNITLPSNYVVGATGDLQNGEKELEWLNEKVKQTELIEKFPTDNSFPPSSAEFKTLTYFQKNVHDFAWFADKRYYVLKGEVELPNSKEKVTLWSMFTNAEGALWNKSIEYLHDAVYYYSLWNGDYPYRQVTAVDGALSAGGGMEYPNVTVIGHSGSAFSLETVIVHEVGHNWFYGILGTNERQHPWMDEGINSFNELRYLRHKYPKAGLLGIPDTSRVAKFFDLKYPQRKQYELFYTVNARRNLDQPIELPAPEYTDFNYGGIAYSKTAVVFDYLREYLGTELFDKSMQTYYDRWKFKHPYPEDLRDIFTEVTQKDLSWFWDEIIPTTKKIDYKIQSIKKVNCLDEPAKICYEIQIKNTAEINSPFSISAVNKDSVLETIWVEGFLGSKKVNVRLAEAEEIIIDAGNYIPEINRRNGFSRTSGLFKKANPFKLQLLGSIEHPVKNQLFLTPVVGWNNYNKLMAGAAFYNNLIPQKKFEYLIMPMYSFGTNSLNGIFNTHYNFYPNHLFQNIRAGFQAERFAISNFIKYQHYEKYQPKIEFELKKANKRSSITNFINLRSVFIREDNLLPEFSTDGSFKQYALSKKEYLVNEIEFLHKNKQAVNPYDIRVFLQQGENFMKANLEAIYTFSYPGKKKGVDLRFFAGKFILNDGASSQYNFSMAGNNDYMYDYIFLDRRNADPVLSRQFAMNDGGFKNFSTLSSSDDWLSSINIQIAAPGRIPLALYADAGLVTYSNSAEVPIAWNSGIALVVAKDIFEIYFPLAMSSDLNQLNYFQKVRFILNIQNVNPFNILRQF